VSTNATHALTDQWRKILTGFKEVVINTSIDGIGSKFTYLRHPGKWEDAEHNIKEFFNLEYTNTNITVVPVVTVSALNVWNISEVFDYFANYNTEPFIILVQWPLYYCVNVLPDNIKPLVEQKLNSYHNSKFDAIVNLMKTVPKTTLPQTLWQQFKFWTKEKDAYRKENFVETFPAIGQLLISHNQWD
jgi:sulfatase maturation enzyme AslB (radical SAM superfamily)